MLMDAPPAAAGSDNRGRERIMSGSWIDVEAADGHTFRAWRAAPEGPPKAGLVILQEIFGVNDHIRHVVEEYARRGYLALAPALFDRVRRNVELDYTDFAPGREIVDALGLDEITLDLEAGIGAVRNAGRVGAVGYCWGGAIADLAACRTDVDAAVAYYGRALVNWLDEKPRCPVLYHFGEKDPLIPMDLVARIRAARPGQEVHVYPGAGHGFSCDARPDFHPASAELALKRTLDFFGRHLHPA